MSRPETSMEPAVGIGRTRALLVVFGVLWVTLAVGVLRYGEALVGGTDDGASEVSRVMASGASRSAMSEREADRAPGAPPADASAAAVAPAEGRVARADGAADTAADDAATDDAAADGRGVGAATSGADVSGARVGAEDGVAERGIAEEDVAEGGVAEEDVAEAGVAEESATEAGIAEAGVSGESAADDPLVGRDGTVADRPAVEDVDGGGGEGEGGASLAEATSPAPAGARGASDAPSSERADTSPDAVASAESAFETRRREELATLARLLGTMRFERLGSEPVASARESLERAFEILFLYPEVRLELVVSGRETSDAAADRRLARERGGRLVDYLVSRGIERERLAVGTGDGRGLPFGEHRVRVNVDDDDR